MLWKERKLAPEGSIHPNNGRLPEELHGQKHNWSFLKSKYKGICPCHLCGYFAKMYKFLSRKLHNLLSNTQIVVNQLK